MTTKKEPVAVAGYDDDGNAQVFHLAPGEKLPAGFHDKPPRGTHPHDVERGIEKETHARKHR